MTTIKSISFKGFKSFAKKTDIPFGNDFNIILGPNGSGKSNVVDALCFVLGKSSAKGLRAERSANLIYNGGKTKNPAKEAEVSVVFNNSKKQFPTKEKEVKITRIVKQSGQSTYKINDETRTRQQILELMGAARVNPDGHNIILQGDIIKFTDMKPMERREILEEASGISVYEEKKQQSLRELEKVEKKLGEAKIILTEREAYLKELKKDRDQALKYKNIEKNIKRNKATGLHLQIKDKEDKKQETLNRIKNQENEINKIKNNIKIIQESIANKKNELSKINDEMGKKGEKEQILLHKDIEQVKEQLIVDTTRLETCKKEIKKLNERNIQLKKDHSSIGLEINNLQREKENLEKKKRKKEFEIRKAEENLQDKKSKAGFSELNKKIENIDKDMENTQYELLKLQEQKQELINKKNNLKFELMGTDEKINSYLNLKKEDKQKVEDVKKHKQEFKKTLLDLSKKTDEISQISAQLSNARKKLTETTENLARLKSREITAKEQTQGNLAIKRILSMKKGIYGTVSDLGEVNSKYSSALEIAAGSRINNIVVEDDVTATRYIKYLKENRLGVATFLPLNKINPPRISQEISKKGVHGKAIDLITFESKFRKIFQYVFGNTIVVENIETARSIGIGTHRMVTLDGDLIEQSGAMIGGFRRKKFGSFSEKEITKDMSFLKKESSRLRDICLTLEDKKIKTEEEMIKLKERKTILEINITNSEKILPLFDINELKKNKVSIIKSIAPLDREISSKESSLREHSNLLEKLKNEKTKAREKTKDTNLINTITKLENSLEKLREGLNTINLKTKNYEMQTNTIHLPEKNKISNILKNNRKEIENLTNEIDELNEKTKQNKNHLKQKQNKEKAFSREFKTLFTKRNRINEITNKQENLIIREQDKIKFIEDKLNSLSLDKARIISELEGLNKEFEEYTDIQLKRGIPLPDLKYETRKFESILKNMGNVNLRALEIYERVNEEYQKIVYKADTLNNEKQDVLHMIKEIDKKKHKIFMKTFNIIHTNFKDIFASLSTKGEAHLELEDKENVFNGGILIKVRLIGNKFLDIKSLSGGEKTLTALSFIFAIQEYSPSPFYMLDEVDAALDKTNSTLLSRLIQKYSQSSQYIVISHNDNIITEANKIYGVSMQEGVTKVVSLKV